MSPWADGWRTASELLLLPLDSTCLVVVGAHCSNVVVDAVEGGKHGVLLLQALGIVRYNVWRVVVGIGNVEFGVTGKGGGYEYCTCAYYTEWYVSYSDSY